MKQVYDWLTRQLVEHWDFARRHGYWALFLLGLAGNVAIWLVFLVQRGFCRA